MANWLMAFYPFQALFLAYAVYAVTTRRREQELERVWQMRCRKRTWIAMQNRLIKVMREFQTMSRMLPFSPGY
jgi:hypothetical protein